MSNKTKQHLKHKQNLKVAGIPEATAEHILHGLTDPDKPVIPSQSVIDTQLKAELDRQPVLYHQLSIGAMVDGVETFTKQGANMQGAALTTAKTGIYDKITVSGKGADYDSNVNHDFITFNKRIVCDNEAIFKLTVRVDALNVDGTTGKTWIAVGGGWTSDYTGDGGGSSRCMYQIELINKQIRAQIYGVVTPTDTYVSPNTLASVGDILELKMTRDLKDASMSLEFLNTTNGAYARAKITGLHQLHLMFPFAMSYYFANGAFTVLENKAYSSFNERPVLAFIGDNTLAGYQNDMSRSGYAVTKRTWPQHRFLVMGGNGRGLQTVQDRQMQEVLKHKPQYALLNTVSGIYDGSHKPASGGYVAFKANFEKVLDTLIANNITPIVMKFPLNAFTNSDGSWGTFIDLVKSTRPTLKVWDISSLQLQWNGGWGSAGLADADKMSDSLVAFLKQLDSAVFK